MALKLGDAERVKTVAFGGGVQVRSAQGGVVWLSRGPLPSGPASGAAGGLEEEDATHVVAARDVIEGKRAGVRVEARAVASGVVAFPVAELRRLLGAGHVVPAAGRGAARSVPGAPRAPAAADPEGAWLRAAAAIDAARGAPGGHAGRAPGRHRGRPRTGFRRDLPLVTSICVTFFFSSPGKWPLVPNPLFSHNIGNIARAMATKTADVGGERSPSNPRRLASPIAPVPVYNAGPKGGASPVMRSVTRRIDGDAASAACTGLRGRRPAQIAGPSHHRCPSGGFERRR